MPIASSTPMFENGDKIEVLKRRQDAGSLWFPAVVLVSSLTNVHLRHVMHVEFETLKAYRDDDKPLREYVGVSDVRPAPPRELHKSFKVGDVVEAFCGERKGWRKARVLDILENSKYVVCDDTNGGSEKHVKEMELEGLRVYRVWNDGFWLQPIQSPELSSEADSTSRVTKRLREESLLTGGLQKNSKSKLGKLTGRHGQAAFGSCFILGAKVEVTSNQEGYKGSWYTGVIVEDLGNSKYLVRYDTLVTDDETEPLKEEVDALDIRPSPPVVQQTENFRPHQEVDAWFNDGWWVGEVCRVLEGPKYSVYFKTSSEVLEFQHSDLRPHQDWINQEWT